MRLQLARICWGLQFYVPSNQLKHSHKKKYSPETWAWLLFMLLKYFFASARPHRAHKNFFFKSAVHGWNMVMTIWRWQHQFVVCSLRTSLFLEQRKHPLTLMKKLIHRNIERQLQAIVKYSIVLKKLIEKSKSQR